MLTTDGATRRTAPVTAREYASSRESSPTVASGAIADSACGLSCHAPGSDIPDNCLAGCDPVKTLPDSSRFMLDRCRSIYFGFNAAHRSVTVVHSALREDLSPCPQPRPPREAAKRRKNAAHGASRGKAGQMRDQPQRGERIATSLPGKEIAAQKSRDQNRSRRLVGWLPG